MGLLGAALLLLVFGGDPSSAGAHSPAEHGTPSAPQRDADVALQLNAALKALAVRGGAIRATQAPSEAGPSEAAADADDIDLKVNAALRALAAHVATQRRAGIEVRTVVPATDAAQEDVAAARAAARPSEVETPRVQDPEAAQTAAIQAQRSASAPRLISASSVAPRSSREPTEGERNAKSTRPDPHDGPHYNEDYYQAIESHVKATLGKHELVWHELVSPDIHVDILPVPPTAKRPFWTLITAGMSYRHMTLPAQLAAQKSEWGRAEVVIALPADWFGPRGPIKKALEKPELFYPIQLLKSVARYPHNNATWLGPGHIIDRGARLGPGTRQSAVMMHWPDALPESFHRLKLTDGETVNFYSIYPLYEQERALAVASGVDALLDAFESKNIEFLTFQPKRANAASRNPLSLLGR
ncbi:MAG: suppressor of fused domain protein [Pseudomonadota bacterium]